MKPKKSEEDYEDNGEFNEQVNKFKDIKWFLQVPSTTQVWISQVWEKEESLEKKVSFHKSPTKEEKSFRR